jgi:non-ribosomal peptide synthase protein (TIGR01720 family)
LGFGLLRWLNPTTQKVLEPLPTAQISFNYLGRFNTKQPQNEQSRWSDEIFVDGPENSEQRRFHIIDITALVDARGRLQMRCRYSRSSYVAKNIEDLMSLFESELIAFSTMHTASR